MCVCIDAITQRGGGVGLKAPVSFRIAQSSATACATCGCTTKQAPMKASLSASCPEAIGPARLLLEELHTVARTGDAIG